MVLASAQSIIYYQGLGRSEIDSDHIEGEFMDDDTVSDRRDLNGRFLFDLGINVEPGKQLRATAVLRLNNTFGGFYSQGSNLEFRQILLQGVLAEKFNYQIGDMDLKLTPYTLFNDNENYYEFESDLFGIRRDVVNYENFNNGNNWRLQGIQSSTTLKYDKVVEKVFVNAFGTRVRRSNITTTPDRLLLGGNVAITQSDFFSLGLNTVNMLDVVGTSNDTSLTYENHVHTANFALNKTVADIPLALIGEFGLSKTNIQNATADLDSTKNGDFYDIAITADIKKINTRIALSYRSVNDAFISPGAQSRRILSGPQNMYFTPTTLFTAGLNGSGLRNQTLYDRITDENMFNQSLSPTLMHYNPAYNNVTPYGVATPNRKGLSFDVNHGNKDSLLFAHVHADLLSETIGEGQSERRNFTAIEGGLLLNVSKLIQTKRLLALSSGFKLEQTKRASNTTSVDLSSTLLDVGLAVETFKKLDLLLGLKTVSASGNEYYNLRGADLNDISNYIALDMDFKETVSALGLRYRFSDVSFFTLNANLISFDEKQDDLYAKRDYTISQYYFNFTVKF